VVADAVAHLPGEVEAPAVLQPLHYAQALLVVRKAAGHHAVQKALARVPERRVPEVVPQRDGLGQVLVEPQRPHDGARYLRDLQRVGKARAVVVAFRRYEHLRFVLEPAERFAMEYAVAVALEVGAQGTGRDGRFTPARARAESGRRAQHAELERFTPLSDVLFQRFSPLAAPPHTVCMIYPVVLHAAFPNPLFRQTFSPERHQKGRDVPPLFPGTGAMPAQKRPAGA